MKKFQRFFCIVISAAMLAIISPDYVKAEQVKNDDGIITDGTVIVGYTNRMSFSDWAALDLETRYKTTTAIGEGAFNNTIQNTMQGAGSVGICPITSISGGSYTSIGSQAFRNALNLKAAKLPDTVINMGTRVFHSCVELTEVEYSANMTSIPDETFLGATKLPAFNVPRNVKSIGSQAFYNCTSLSSITFQSNSTLETIGTQAFYNVGLTNVTIPENVKSVGSQAFYDCTKLTSITIPNSVTEIGASAFRGCPLTGDIMVSENVISIGGDAFPTIETAPNYKIVTTSEYVADWCRDNNRPYEYIPLSSSPAPPSPTPHHAVSPTTQPTSAPTPAPTKKPAAAAKAAKPKVTSPKKRKISVKRKKKLTLKIKAKNMGKGGKLTYQWQASKKQKSGFKNIKGKAAKKKSYKPSTKKKGRKFYRCRVTHTVGKTKKNRASKVFRVTVK
ncbi:MAG: leucine-rich repeat domain-containing protein [Oscillospiraceae bacterium]|nr:leucine-rich repeat domain-containing protein [Oscillospiraceae bacterium]